MCCQFSVIVLIPNILFYFGGLYIFFFLGGAQGHKFKFVFEILCFTRMRSGYCACSYCKSRSLDANRL